jgi:hypothetical protein
VRRVHNPLLKSRIKKTPGYVVQKWIIGYLYKVNTCFHWRFKTVNLEVRIQKTTMNEEDYIHDESINNKRKQTQNKETDTVTTSLNMTQRKLLLKQSRFSWGCDEFIFFQTLIVPYLEVDTLNQYQKITVKHFCLSWNATEWEIKFKKGMNYLAIDPNKSTFESLFSTRLKTKH